MKDFIFMFIVNLRDRIINMIFTKNQPNPTLPDLTQFQYLQYKNRLWTGLALARFELMSFLIFASFKVSQILRKAIRQLYLGGLIWMPSMLSLVSGDLCNTFHIF